MDIKSKIFKDAYTKGISIGLLMIFGPIILFLLFYGLSLLVPFFDSGTALGIMILGIPSAMFGLILATLSALLLGVKVVCKRIGIQYYRLFSLFLIAIPGGIFIWYGVQMPTGPDECSQSPTIEEYTACLEDIFAGKSEQEVHIWLGQHGYTYSKNYDIGSGLSTFSMQHYSDLPVSHYFMARRSYGRPDSLPYGNNFKRWFLPVYPAPATFKIGIGVDRSAEKYYVYRDTAIET